VFIALFGLEKVVVYVGVTIVSGSSLRVIGSWVGVSK